MTVIKDKEVTMDDNDDTPMLVMPPTFATNGWVKLDEVYQSLEAGQIIWLQFSFLPGKKVLTKVEGFLYSGRPMKRFFVAGKSKFMGLRIYHDLVIPERKMSACTVSTSDMDDVQYRLSAPGTYQDI